MKCKRALKIFSRLTNIYDQFFQTFDPNQRTSVENAIHSLLKSARLYFQVVTKEQNIKKGKQFTDVLKTFILHLHIKFAGLNEEYQNVKEKNLFLELLAKLVDFYLFLNQSQEIYLKRAIQDLYLYTGNCPEDIATVLLKCRLVKKRYSEFCYPLLRHILHQEPVIPLAPKNYVQYLFLYRLWKNCCKCNIEKNKVLSLAAKLKISHEKTVENQSFIDRFKSVFSLYGMPFSVENLYTSEFYEYWISKRLPLDFLQHVRKALCDDSTSLQCPEVVDALLCNAYKQNVKNPDGNDDLEGCVQFEHVLPTDIIYNENNFVSTEGPMEEIESTKNLFFVIDTKGKTSNKNKKKTNKTSLIEDNEKSDKGFNSINNKACKRNLIFNEDDSNLNKNIDNQIKINQTNKVNVEACDKPFIKKRRKRLCDELKDSRKNSISGSQSERDTDSYENCSPKPKKRKEHYGESCEKKKKQKKQNTECSFSTENISVQVKKLLPSEISHKKITDFSLNKLNVEPLHSLPKVSKSCDDIMFIDHSNNLSHDNNNVEVLSPFSSKLSTHKSLKKSKQKVNKLCEENRKKNELFSTHISDKKHNNFTNGKKNEQSLSLHETIKSSSDDSNNLSFGDGCNKMHASNFNLQKKSHKKSKQQESRSFSLQMSDKHISNCKLNVEGSLSNTLEISANHPNDGVAIFNDSSNNFSHGDKILSNSLKKCKRKYSTNACIETEGNCMPISPQVINKQLGASNDGEVNIKVPQQALTEVQLKSSNDVEVHSDHSDNLGCDNDEIFLLHSEFAKKTYEKQKNYMDLHVEKSSQNFQDKMAEFDRCCNYKNTKQEQPNKKWSKLEKNSIDSHVEDSTNLSCQKLLQEFDFSSEISPEISDKPNNCKLNIDIIKDCEKTENNETSLSHVEKDKFSFDNKSNDETGEEFSMYKADQIIPSFDVSGKNEIITEISKLPSYDSNFDNIPIEDKILLISPFKEKEKTPVCNEYKSINVETVQHCAKMSLNKTLDSNNENNGEIMNEKEESTKFVLNRKETSEQALVKDVRQVSEVMETSKDNIFSNVDNYESVEYTSTFTENSNETTKVSCAESNANVKKSHSLNIDTTDNENQLNTTNCFIKPHKIDFFSVNENCTNNSSILETESKNLKVTKEVDKLHSNISQTNNQQNVPSYTQCSSVDENNSNKTFHVYMLKEPTKKVSKLIIVDETINDTNPSPQIPLSNNNSQSVNYEHSSQEKVITNDEYCKIQTNRCEVDQNVSKLNMDNHNVQSINTYNNSLDISNSLLEVKLPTINIPRHDELKEFSKIDSLISNSEEQHTNYYNNECQIKDVLNVEESLIQKSINIESKFKSSEISVNDEKFNASVPSSDLSVKTNLFLWKYDGPDFSDISEKPNSKDAEITLLSFQDIKGNLTKLVEKNKQGEKEESLEDNESFHSVSSSDCESNMSSPQKVSTHNQEKKSPSPKKILLKRNPSNCVIVNNALKNMNLNSPTNGAKTEMVMEECNCEPPALFVRRSARKKSVNVGNFSESEMEMRKASCRKLVLSENLTAVSETSPFCEKQSDERKYETSNRYNLRNRKGLITPSKLLN